jgi:hypothetical protein
MRSEAYRRLKAKVAQHTASLESRTSISALTKKLTANPTLLLHGSGGATQHTIAGFAELLHGGPLCGFTGQQHQHALPEHTEAALVHCGQVLAFPGQLLAVDALDLIHHLHACQYELTPMVNYWRCIPTAVHAPRTCGVSRRRGVAGMNAGLSITNESPS